MAQPAKKSCHNDTGIFATTGKSYYRSNTARRIPFLIHVPSFSVLQFISCPYAFVYRSKTDPGYMFEAQTVALDLNQPQAEEVVGGLMDAVHGKWPHEVQFLMMQLSNGIIVMPMREHDKDLKAYLETQGIKELEVYLESQQIEYLLYSDLPNYWDAPYRDYYY